MSVYCGRKYGSPISEKQHNRIVEKQLRRCERKILKQTLGQLKRKAKEVSNE